MSARTWPDPGRTVDCWADPPDHDPSPPGRWLRPERERAPIGPLLPSVDDLLRLGCDHAPSLAAEGADRVLGPYALEAPLAARREAVALAAFLLPDDDDATPIDRWLRETRDRDRADGVRAARWAPLAPFRAALEAPGVARLAPLLPMGTGAPDGPVAWRPLPDPTGDAAGDLIFARVARDPHGWRVVAGVSVPEGPPGLLARLADALPPGRPPTTEGTLRRAGHVLLRRWLEHHWATKTTIPTPTP